MKPETLLTIGEAPDGLGERVQPVLAELDPPKATGRKRAEPRRILKGIVFRLRTGCPWNQLPQAFGDDSIIHRTFQRWGVLSRIWGMLVQECEERGGVAWEWQAADSATGKARWGDPVGPNPPDRGKAGSKRSILGEGEGGPLSVVVAGANVHDTKLLRATLEAIVVERPKPTAEAPQHLCLDTG